MPSGMCGWVKFIKGKVVNTENTKMRKLIKQSLINATEKILTNESFAEQVAFVFKFVTGEICPFKMNYEDSKITCQQHGGEYARKKVIDEAETLILFHLNEKSFYVDECVKKMKSYWVGLDGLF